MITGTQWQADVGRAWAAMADRTDRTFSGLMPVLLERIARTPGDAVLDIGCGAGELTLAAARARPDAQVIGLDISPELADVARVRASGQGNCRFVTGDAASWREPGFAPDLLMSRHGVMFFDAPVPAFAALHAQAASDARLVFSCFRFETENPWAWDLARLVAWPDQPVPGSGPDAPPGPFAFADTRRVAGILEAAGWRDVRFEAVDYTYMAGDGENAVAEAVAFLSRIGPAARAMRELDEVGQERIRARMEAWLTGNCIDGRVSFPAAAWIVTAQA